MMLLTTADDGDSVQSDSPGMFAPIFFPLIMNIYSKTSRIRK